MVKRFIVAVIFCLMVFSVSSYTPPQPTAISLNLSSHTPQNPHTIEISLGEGTSPPIDTQADICSYFGLSLAYNSSNCVYSNSTGVFSVSSSGGLCEVKCQ